MRVDRSASNEEASAIVFDPFTPPLQIDRQQLILLGLRDSK